MHAVLHLNSVDTIRVTGNHATVRKKDLKIFISWKRDLYQVLLLMQSDRAAMAEEMP
jgi:hypothetical protein